MWKKMKHCDYEVSSDGKIRRTTTITSGKAGHILKPCVKRKYLGVTISVGDHRYTGMIHKLVCEAFHGQKLSPIHQVGHLNGNHLDNRAENLHWVTPTENEAEKRKMGRSIYGSKHPLSKLTEDDVRIIKDLVSRRRFTHKRVAGLFGVSSSKVGQIMTGRSWRHVK